MKKEGKNLKRKDGLDIDFTNCKKVMSSNLPLLFANGQPRSLETISQPELEEFVPFMVRCSLGQEILKKPKEINNCPAPEWWPQGFPFRFPLIEQSDWINDLYEQALMFNKPPPTKKKSSKALSLPRVMKLTRFQVFQRLVMLKSLVCRCYTFYDCEFLLKFSSELAEMSPSHLRFDENKEENTTSIYDANGCMLVKCRNENLNYDMHKNHRRYLSPAHRSSLNQAKKFEPVIDLTFDTSSEDEKEVYFKETAPPTSRKPGKRKTSVDRNEEPAAKQRCVRRVFDDFPQERPEPTEYSQELYMEKFQLIPLGKEIRREVLKVERRKRLARSFNILSVSSRRGQELLMRNKHSFNVESSLYRIDRFCGPGSQDDAESSQVYTRAAAVFSAMYKQDEDNMPEDKGNAAAEKRGGKWCHSYKWPHKTHNPVYPYVGPAVKPCLVLLNKLTEEEIFLHLLKKNKRTVSTMTPEDWWSSELAICKCQYIPYVGLEKPLFIKGLKYKHKKSSTRCTCGRSKSQYIPSPEGKFSLSEVRMEASSEELRESAKQESSVKSRSRASNENTLHRSGGFSDSGASLSCSSHDPSLGTMAHNLPDVVVSHKRVLFRRPLAVVPSTPPAAVGCSSLSDLPAPHSHALLSQHITPASSVKVNFSKSILDAIKWYTKDDPASLLSDGLCEFSMKEEVKTIDPSQENIKPLTELTLPSLVKPIDYFQQNLNVAEYDYCFKRTTDGTAKLVTRRGERHYVNRDPCPSCSQGRDNFCVYEFVRQAKLAGLSLQENQKHLQSWFFNFITAVNKKLA